MKRTLEERTCDYCKKTLREYEALDMVDGDATGVFKDWFTLEKRDFRDIEYSAPVGLEVIGGEVRKPARDFCCSACLIGFLEQENCTKHRRHHNE